MKEKKGKIRKGKESMEEKKGKVYLRKKGFQQ